MKNLSLVLNAILILAVGILYYLHFSSKKSSTVKTKSTVNATTGSSARPPIAYVELDSLNEKITFIKTKRKELEAEQRAIENEWESGYRNLENQRNNFLKKGAAITQ